MSPLPKDREQDPLALRSRVSTATTSRGTTSASVPLPWANDSFLADFRRDLNRDIATVTANAIGQHQQHNQQQQQQQQQRLTDWIKANPSFLTGPVGGSGDQDPNQADYSFAPSATATDASFNFNLTSLLLDDHLHRPRQQDKRPSKHHSLLHASDGARTGTPSGAIGEGLVSDLVNDSQINHVRGELQALAARGSALAAAIGASDTFDQSLSLSTMFPVPPVPPALPDSTQSNVNHATAFNSDQSRPSNDDRQDGGSENDDDDDDSVLPFHPGQQAVPQHAYIGGRGFTSAEDADQAAVIYADPASRIGRRPPLFPVPALDSHNNNQRATSMSSSTDQEPGSPTPIATKSSKSLPNYANTGNVVPEPNPPRLPSLELDVQMGSTTALLDAVAAEGASSSSSPPLTPRPKSKSSRREKQEERRGSQESTITGPPSSFLLAVQQQVRSGVRPTTPPPPAQPMAVPPVATTPPRQTRATQPEAYVTSVKDRADLGYAEQEEEDDDDDDLTHAHLLPKYPSMPRVVSTPKSKSKASAPAYGHHLQRPAAAVPGAFGSTRPFATVSTSAPAASAPHATSAPSPPSPSSPPTDPLYSHPPHELAHAVNQLTAQLRDVTAARDRLLDSVKTAEDDAVRTRAQLENVRGELASVKRHLQVVDLDRERKAEAARMEAGKVNELKVQITSLQRMVRELGETVKVQERQLRQQEAGEERAALRADVLAPGPGSPPMPVGAARRQMVDVGVDSRPETPLAHLQTQTPTAAFASANGTMGMTTTTQYRVLREASVQTDRRTRKDSASSSGSSNVGGANAQGGGNGGGEAEDQDAQVRRARRKVLHAELQREMMRKLRAVAMRRLERERVAAAAAVGEAYELDQHQPPQMERPRSAPVSPARVRVRGRSMDAAPWAERQHYHNRRLDPSPRRHTESSRRKVLATAASTHSHTNASAGPTTSTTSSNGKPPFILGSNPGKSYSLPVNLQRMMSLAKIHAPGLCPHCHGDPHATSHRHPVATVVAHAIPPAENARRKLEEQQHVLHVELARLVRQSDAAEDLKAKREMHPVIQRVIRRLAELDRELEDMGLREGAGEHPEIHSGDSPLVVSAAATNAARHQHQARPASARSSAASSPAMDRKASKAGSRASVSGSGQRAAERPQLRNLSLLRSSQKVQQALLMGT